MSFSLSHITSDQKQKQKSPPPPFPLRDSGHRMGVWWQERDRNAAGRGQSSIPLDRQRGKGGGRQTLCASILRGGVHSS
ncbi:hypothetical protein CEXT_596221 [Caerostris extrusa]|uniref:Uncharacterized protein n=1 Tax=Caerostris extrusa TaxID=172846 RepID=A0AAV4PH35_CAEEX|nr:hypothetical protein CEXT_596221 [Caerostris extrusa]